jgi:hypothetical protein
LTKDEQERRVVGAAIQLRPVLAGSARERLQIAFVFVAPKCLVSRIEKRHFGLI